MKPLTFVVEKTPDGYSAYSEDFEKFPVGTTGKHISELKENILNALNLYQEHISGTLFNGDDITIKYDLPQVFEFYKEINAKALANRVGMNQTLLSQYVNGSKKPSEKQVNKILEGIKSLGRELYELEIA